MFDGEDDGCPADDALATVDHIRECVNLTTEVKPTDLYNTSKYCKQLDTKLYFNKSQILMIYKKKVFAFLEFKLFFVIIDEVACSFLLVIF